MKASTRRGFELAAFEVARNFTTYRGYGGSRGAALRAFRKRAPGFTAMKYETGLSLSERMVSRARDLTDKNRDRLWSEWNANANSFRAAHVASALHREFPAFLLSTSALAIQWAFYWYHLR